MFVSVTEASVEKKDLHCAPKPHILLLHSRRFSAQSGREVDDIYDRFLCQNSCTQSLKMTAL